MPMRLEYLDEINSNFYKNEILRIMKNSDPTDQERLFLVSFLHDQLEWTDIDIYTFVDLYNHWTNYNKDITKRQILRICDRKKKGFLNYSYKNETHIITAPAGAVAPSQSDGVFTGFRFFNENKKGGENTLVDVEITKQFAKINNGHKYIQFVEKIWNKGKDPIHFLSLESGDILTADNGQVFYARPNKFLTLPMNKDLLHTLGEAFINYPSESEGSTKKEKKK